VADQAELVPRRDGRPHDSAGCSAFHVQAGRATVVESRGSHAIYVSRPAPVVALIEQAARALATTASK